jgi:lipopolysaccharide/colanic/teichoic acid biosynthesis glycosyltransferase
MKRSIYLAAKVILDVFFAVILVILTWWIMLICAIAIKLDEPGSPVFYNAERTGKNLKLFRMYKFRTMKMEFEGLDIPEDYTLSRVGRVLRKTSLDELPQIFNVLKGEMSFVGPRPLLESYAPYYSAEENRRHEVKPGITGLAQVNGRITLNWEKRFKLDVEYADNISFLLDIKILILTAAAVLRQQDVMTEDVSDESALMAFDEYRRGQFDAKKV